ncbi:MAG: cytochrome c oxidase assembly protein, partial [Planctomycetia bacterium]|nr:cytochrome c oxidase assembly protein [Planctomycetia bacterium]
PIEPLSFLLLQVHMVQHLLLIMVAPALLWLGAPYLPLLQGLPRAIRLHVVAPWLRLPALQHAWQRLTHPLTAWLLFTAVTWLWHAPALYDLALRSPAWHYVQHACFLVTGLLFWQPVIEPYPGRPRVSRWLLLPYLIFADLTNTALSALLTFSRDVLYPHYAATPRLWGISALEDQAAAGVFMWVPGSLAYLLPLVWIGAKLLYGEEGQYEKPLSPGGRGEQLSHPQPLSRRGRGEQLLQEGHRCRCSTARPPRCDNLSTCCACRSWAACCAGGMPA